MCTCYRQKYVSVTLRRAEGDTELLGQTLEEGSEFRSEFMGKGTAVPTYKLLYKLLLEGKQHKQGVIIIAGGTGSGKSTQVRGIIDCYLKDLVKQNPMKRRPHFVTFEDPIEKFAFATPLAARNAGVDYTPREKGKDAESLESALADALRQTPKLFFIGEVRDDNDWKRVISFAGTGHVVITTTHAGSVSECLNKIFRALKVKTAADRNHVAEKILGVVHLQPVTLQWPGKYGPPPQFWNELNSWRIPAVWHNTPRGVSGIVSDGLASILPYNPHEASVLPLEERYETLEERAKEYSSIGRRGFTKVLTQTIRQTSPELAEQGTDLGRVITELLDQETIKMDMKGM